jgi:hypothetical protein
MTHDQLQHLLTAANPVTSEHARGLGVAEAQEDLLAGLIAQPELEPGAARRSRTRRRRVFTRVGLAVAATAVVLAALLLITDDSNHQGSGTAWAAQQVRFAEASPLVLLGAPGWRVEYADEQSAEEGELRFRRGPTPAPRDMTSSGEQRITPIPADTSSAQLNWRGGRIGSWLVDRANAAVVTTTAPVLGTTAHVYQYEGGTPGHRDITALFRYDGRVLEFRAGAAHVDAFKALLATLKRVDTDAWLSAMPAGVVKVLERDSVLKQMLDGVSVPPGFEPDDIKGADLTRDRYQLGAAVAGTVACEWFKRWADARKANDRVMEREATAAMATAKHWPILKEMAKAGGYPDILFEYVAAMPSGLWYGRPLIGDVDSGLGCKVLGVDLPAAATAGPPSASPPRSAGGRPPSRARG